MTVWADALGTPHATACGEVRIVSLVPSVTELLYALGLGEQLVGRTGFCIHPREGLRSVRKVGGTKDVDLAAVRALAPTHVVVNIDENRREDAEALGEFVPHVVVTHPLAPADNLALYRLLGGIFKREREAATLCAAFESRLEALPARDCQTLQRVLYLIWREPWMSVAPDTYIAQMLALFNWQTLPEAPAQRYPVVNLAEFAGRVDRVLLSSEPYPFRERHIAEIRAAIPGVPVQLIDGEMTSWYGSRAIEGLDYLRAFTAGELPAAQACA